MSYGLSLAQQRALAITPKCTAALSIPSSLFLIYEIYCDHKVKGTTAVQRALLGMSVIDLFSSSAWFLSSWAVPRGSFALSAGTRASCTYQGFLLQLAIGAPLYNCSLAFFYLLLISYGWGEDRIRRFEGWVHGLILAFAIGTSILLLPLEQYNQIGNVCWIIGDPQDCHLSTPLKSSVPCERGDHAWIYGIFLFYGPLWICVGGCIFAMCLVYRKVKLTLEVTSHAQTGRSEASRRHLETEIVATQAMLYSLFFIVTWMPSTIWSLAHWFRFDSFVLDFLSAFCEPLQGLWNLLIFARTRQSTKDKVRKAVHSVLPFLCYRETTLDSSGKTSSDFGQRSSIKRSSNLPSSDLRDLRISSGRAPSSIVIVEDGDLPNVSAELSVPDENDEQPNESLDVPWVEGRTRETMPRTET